MPADGGRSLSGLSARIRAFNEERDWGRYHSPKNLAMALMVEAAELAEHFQWMTPEESRALDAERRAAVAEEAGDVLIYLSNLCDKLGIDLLEAALAKLRKNAEKYPAERVRGSSKKWNEYS